MHPTVNPGAGDILELIRDGKVLARPGIERVDEHTVHFTDGTSEEVDAVICATGEGLICRCDLRPTVEAGVLSDVLQSKARP